MSWGNNWIPSVFRRWFGRPESGQVDVFSRAGWNGWNDTDSFYLASLHNISAILYSCVRVIYQGISKAPLEVGRIELIEENGIETEKFFPEFTGPAEEFRKLFYEHPVYTYHQIMEQLIKQGLLSGVGYFEKIESGGVVREIWPLMTRHVTWMPNHNAGHPVKEFRVYRGEEQKDRVVPFDGLGYWGFMDPSRIWGWAGPAQACARETQLEGEIFSFVAEMVSNSDLSGGVISFDHNFTKEQVEAWTKMQKETSLKFGRGNPRGTHGKYTPPQPLEKYNFSQILGELSGRIGATMGIPSILIPSPWGEQQSSYANAKEARRYMAEETLAPIFRIVEESFTRAIMGPGSPLVYRFNLDKFSALYVDIKGTDAQRDGDFNSDKQETANQPVQDGTASQGDQVL